MAGYRAVDRNRWVSLTAGVALLAVTGCAGSGQTGELVAGQGSTQDPTTAPTSDGVPSQPTEPSVSVPPPTAAADGSDVAACFDGTCEVEVTESTTIAFDEQFGISELVVESITADSVTITDPFGWMQTGVGGTGTINGISFEILAIDGQSAIFRFFPA